MRSLKLIAVFSIIPFCTLATPITSVDERKALEDFLKTMDQQITDEIQSRRQAKCQKNEGFPDESEIAQKVKNLLKKLENSENVTKYEIEKLFKMVEEYYDKMIEKIEQMLKRMEAYNPEWRFYEALIAEMESPKKCTVEFGKSAEIESIHSFVDENRLENIQGKLSKLFILQTMASPKKQNAYRDFFNNYGDKKQDLDKKLEKIATELDKVGSTGSATTKYWDKVTKHFCYVDIGFILWRAGEKEFSPVKALFGLPFWCAHMVLGPIVTGPVDLSRCARKGIGKCKSAWIKSELAKIKAKRAEILQMDTSKDE